MDVDDIRRKRMRLFEQPSQPPLPPPPAKPQDSDCYIVSEGPAPHLHQPDNNASASSAPPTTLTPFSQAAPAPSIPDYVSFAPPLPQESLDPLDIFSNPSPDTISFGEHSFPPAKEMLPKRKPSTAVRGPSRAQDTDLTDEANEVRAFVSHLERLECATCNHRLIAKQDIEKIITRQFSSQIGMSQRKATSLSALEIAKDDLSSLSSMIDLRLVCPKCKDSFTCIGCGQRISQTRHGAQGDGIAFAWHCDTARLSLIWFLLCGYDNQAQHNKPLSIGDSGKTGATTGKRPGRGRRVPAGVGYGGNGYDLDHDDFPMPPPEVMAKNAEEAKKLLAQKANAHKPKKHGGKKQPFSTLSGLKSPYSTFGPPVPPNFSGPGHSLSGNAGHNPPGYHQGPHHNPFAPPAPTPHYWGMAPPAFGSAGSKPVQPQHYGAFDPPPGWIGGYGLFGNTFGGLGHTLSGHPPTVFGQPPNFPGGQGPYGIPSAAGGQPQGMPGGQFPPNGIPQQVPHLPPGFPGPGVYPVQGMPNGDPSPDVPHESGDYSWAYPEDSDDWDDEDIPEFYNPRRKRSPSPVCEDPDDTLTTQVMAALQLLLPSFNGHDTTAIDYEPPAALTSMLLRSSLIDRAAELLRNDSVEDAARRGGLYESVLGFVKALASHYTTSGPAVHGQRIINRAGHDLLRVSMGLPTRMRSETIQTAQPISACFDGLCTQSKMVIKQAQMNEQEFQAEDGQRMLWICRNVCDLAEVMQPTTSQVTGQADMVGNAPAESKDAWRKELAMLDVPDETILSSHVYGDEARKLGDPPAGRMRELVKEITRLKTGLPPGIFVRYGESRMDVMKILIVGPEGTPYEHGLWEFDLLCGINYPNQPPQMSFRTTGGGVARVNPNLYDCGKVCLSLLGTWSGEQWRPGKSTLLQVLVSIQAMIFCDEPHCNEPSFERDRGSEQSKAYNRKVYAMTVKHAMLDWLGVKTSGGYTRSRRGRTLADGRILIDDGGKPASDGAWNAVIEKHFESNRAAIIETVDQWVADKPPPPPTGRARYGKAPGGKSAILSKDFVGTGSSGQTLGGDGTGIFSQPPPQVHPNFPSPPPAPPSGFFAAKTYGDGTPQYSNTVMSDASDAGSPRTPVVWASARQTAPAEVPPADEKALVERLKGALRELDKYGGRGYMFD